MPLPLMTDTPVYSELAYEPDKGDTSDENLSDCDVSDQNDEDVSDQNDEEAYIFPPAPQPPQMLSLLVHLKAQMEETLETYKQLYVERFGKHTELKFYISVTEENIPPELIEALRLYEILRILCPFEEYITNSQNTDQDKMQHIHVFFQFVHLNRGTIYTLQTHNMVEITLQILLFLWKFKAEDNDDIQLLISNSILHFLTSMQHVNEMFVPPTINIQMLWESAYYALGMQHTKGELLVNAKKILNDIYSTNEHKIFKLLFKRTDMRVLAGIDPNRVEFKAFKYFYDSHMAEIKNILPHDRFTLFESSFMLYVGSIATYVIDTCVDLMSHDIPTYNQTQIGAIKDMCTFLSSYTYENYHNYGIYSQKNIETIMSKIFMKAIDYHLFITKGGFYDETKPWTPIENDFEPSLLSSIYDYLWFLLFLMKDKKEFLWGKDSRNFRLMMYDDNVGDRILSKDPRYQNYRETFKQLWRLYSKEIEAVLGTVEGTTDYKILQLFKSDTKLVR